MSKNRASIRTRGVDFLHDRKDEGATIDLHGSTADDAETEIDRFVNEQVMEGNDLVKIIHGHGKGILKRRVEDWLKRNTDVLVESYESFGPGYHVRLIDVGTKHSRRFK